MRCIQLYHTAWDHLDGVKEGVTYKAAEVDRASAATARSRMWWKSTTCNATMLRLLGIDHKRLAYRFQGHDFRLIDVRGEAVKKMLF